MNKTLLTLGLLITLLAAALLLMNVIPFGVAAAIAVFGIGLVAVVRRKNTQPESKPAQQTVEIVYSSDRQMRAVIKQRGDGKYQVEVWKLVSDYSQDFGPGSQWARQPAGSITDTLSDAMDIATSHVRGGDGITLD
jgi:hypothetical protein